ncbi:hypothetical protein BC939DRAFT_512182 [Gamsiella multidivaricata]|uniref:uncharacterized protein n=1 Tax=Gamsiella multidivaricata TaxID=101098 RepID=UPI0022206ADF|nr:uncharacterized protein BC939DRAFT_512182 [Gamsiella multidivaricata]KAI7816004.1 hypothetical protein BC939DRAFT_512182 [Gamsiella multidivaricata]
MSASIPLRALTGIQKSSLETAVSSWAIWKTPRVAAAATIFRRQQHPLSTEAKPVPQQQYQRQQQRQRQKQPLSNTRSGSSISSCRCHCCKRNSNQAQQQQQQDQPCAQENSEASVQKREHSDTAHLDTGPGSVKEVNKDILFVIAEAVWELNREVRAELNRLQPKKKGEENSMENGSKTKTSTAEAAVCKGCHKSERQKTAPVDPAIAQLEQEILERVLGRHGLSKEDWGAWKTLQQKRHKEAHPKIGNVVDIAEMWKKWKSERWVESE